MPCFVTGSAEGDARLAQQEAQKEATKVTRLLCQLCRQVEGEFGINHLPHDVKKWWVRHKEIDEKRIKERAEAVKRVELRKKALKKLSPEERRALGIEYDEKD